MEKTFINLNVFVCKKTPQDTLNELPESMVLYIRSLRVMALWLPYAALCIQANKRKAVCVYWKKLCD